MVYNIAILYFVIYKTFFMHNGNKKPSIQSAIILEQKCTFLYAAKSCQSPTPQLARHTVNSTVHKPLSAPDNFINLSTQIVVRQVHPIIDSSSTIYDPMPL